MIHTFLEVGGLIFWVITAVVLLLSVSELESEKFTATSITLLVYGAVVILLTNGGTLLVNYLTNHPLYILYGVLGYLLAGAIWATAKWRFFFLPNLFDKYAGYREKFLKEEKLKEIPADLTVRAEFSRYCRGFGFDINELRMVRRNKARITAWMAYWPLSLLGTFFGDFLTRVFKSLYNMIAGFLQRLSDGMARQYSELDN